jgi:large subunit ribosomal protein L24
MKMSIKKNDLVKVIAGDDKGKEGRVIEVLSKESRLVVEGINIHKRHMRKSPANPEGGILEREFPIAISNVMLVDPDSKKATRIRTERTEKDGKVQVKRIAVKSGKEIKLP